jgi:Uma2 family endonuclease
MTTQTLVSAEEFLDLPEREGVRLELSEGRIVEMASASPLHCALQSRFSHWFEAWIDQFRANFYAFVNLGFVLETATVRIPDVSLVRKSSFASMERVRGVLRGAPELAIEVVSEHEEAADLDLKIRQYLNAGATAVWAVYPKTRHVLAYRRSGETRDVGPGQTLEEPDVLPGLQIPVDELFAGLEALAS